jgi:hypothetical protein
MKFRPLPPLSVLNEKFIYEPDTGDFRDRKTLALRGSINKDSDYVLLKVDDYPYLAHRIAWKMYYGVEPKHRLDHKDGVKWNNRILNIREATQQGNCANKSKSVNNSSGFKNLHFNGKRITVIISKDRKKHTCSFQNTESGLADALEWRDNKGRELFGEFWGVR